MRSTYSRLYVKVESRTIGLNSTVRKSTVEFDVQFYRAKNKKIYIG